MNRKTPWIMAAIVLAGLTVGVMINLSKAPKRERSVVSSPAPQIDGRRGQTNRVLKTSADPFTQALLGLKRVHSAQQAREQLARLKASLRALPTKERARVLLDFLESHADLPTTLDFKIGPNGLLLEAPTLRTFAIDALAQANPKAAADYSKQLLASRTSADEWALAFRNCARLDSTLETRSFLQSRFEEMVRVDAWRDKPSAGFLEAFDLPVYLHATNLVPLMADLLRDKDNRAVSHAAYLTLDRLTISDPAPVLATLLSRLDLLSGNDGTRANFFARADVGDRAQRRLVEEYLAKIAPTELNTFAGSFPNANYMISQNLLTQTPTPDSQTLRQRDKKALAVVEEWLANPQFEKLRPQLESIKSRLERFVK